MNVTVASARNSTAKFTIAGISSKPTGSMASSPISISLANMICATSVNSESNFNVMIPSKTWRGETSFQSSIGEGGVRGYFIKINKSRFRGVEIHISHESKIIIGIFVAILAFPAIVSLIDVKSSLVVLFFSMAAGGLTLGHLHVRSS